MAPEKLSTHLDLYAAIDQELSYHNRLMPPRWDELQLRTQQDSLLKWLRARVNRPRNPQTASIVRADKGWRGSRPLSIVQLEDRIQYRAMVNTISESLPRYLTERTDFDSFRRSAAAVEGAMYISTADVASYYVYVDHEVLFDELIAQTGSEFVVSALVELLGRVMGSHVGLPQVNRASDILADTYLDPARRRLVRAGFSTFTYADDFRIATRTFGEARLAIESCAAEIHKLGLVLNERKTYTYTKKKYLKDLNSFRDAEQRLFLGDSEATLAEFDALESFYNDVSEDLSDAQHLGDTPLDISIDDSEALAEQSETASQLDETFRRRVTAAGRAWELWADEDEDEETQAGRQAAITQSLLAQALPILGQAGNSSPIDSLDMLLRFEPAITPQICNYLTAFGANGARERGRVRSALDQLVAEPGLSSWQTMWLMEACGGARRTKGDSGSARLQWLAEAVSSGTGGVAATAAAALGRLKYGDSDELAAVVDRVGPEWRQLALWGLGQIDIEKARTCADSELDRLVLNTNSQS